MLKTDYKKEVESTLKLIREEIDKGILEGNVELAFNKINKGMKALIGLDINTIDTLAFKQVIDLISKDNQYNADRYIALGQLLYFQGYVYGVLENEINKVNYYKKSVEGFYEAYLEEEDIDSNYLNDISKVLDEISNYEIDLSYNKKVFRLYEVCNNFDKAENILFDMIKGSNKDKEIIDLGISFYERLKEKPEEELEDGNLPLEEVEDSLQDLKNIRI
ncbi:DUF6483 family protein [uncultured Clostridium sp.]|uniref:DUF6483 family protein n=1 Tax=uncultured Clostridium sp. TaxID=59620 RepID=UPI0025F6EA2A|nr:DUF6483 family protein [uncultured Clostridium sp.]